MALKPSKELRQRLNTAGIAKAEAGNLSDAGLEICNTFYTEERIPGSDGSSHDTVYCEYWTTMVAVLCERIAKLQYDLAQAKKRRR